MKLVKTKKSGALILGIIALFQIFVLTNAIPAESYSIGEIENAGRTASVEKKVPKLSPKFFSILVSFFAIKQIGFVSAIDENFNCCISGAETEDGIATCQDITPTQASGGECQGQVLSSRCEETSQCKTGTCVVGDGVSCSSSPKVTCESGGGEWVDKTPANVPECRRGCCIIGSGSRFETSTQCEIDGGNFNAGIGTEAACILAGQNLLQGACVTTGNACTFTTGIECGRRSGSFFKGILCTNSDLKENLDVECEASTQTTIKDDKIYWIDSCGNLANIYDADKIYEKDKSYWEIVSPPTCKVLDSNGNVIKNNLGTCGNLDRFRGTIAVEASEADVIPAYGNFAGKDLSCTYKDSVKNIDITKKNGEKWCIYEGSIGDIEGISSDTVGSEHWLARCENGDLKLEHSNYRDSVCAQRTTVVDLNGDGDTNDNGEGESFTTASLVPNQALACPSFNPLQDKKGKANQANIDACNANPHCAVRNVDVQKHNGKPTFYFSVCVPRYPTGFDDDSAAQTMCAAATQKCTQIYQKNIGSLWGSGSSWNDAAKINSECGNVEFSQKMNNLCVSMGDCGSYVNYEGQGSDNAQITYEKGGKSGKKPEKIPAIFSWTNYVKYSDRSQFANQIISLPEPEETSGEGDGSTNTGSTNQFEDIDPMGQLNEGFGEFLSSIFGNNNPTLRDINIQNTLGIGGTTMWGIAQFWSGVAPIGDSSYLAGYQTYTTELAANTAKAGIVTLFATIGAYAGAYIAQQLGISGGPAQMLVLAGGTAGGTLSYVYIATTSSPWALGFGIGALVIVGWIIISGFGTTEKRKINFACLPWEAPAGTTEADCNKCNENELFKCTKYRCESLGQTCQLLNGNTDNPICKSVQYENVAPVITAGSINATGYAFADEDVGKSVEIESPEENGCILEFGSVRFTLKTDEYAQCKWDFVERDVYENMENLPLEGTDSSKNHTFDLNGLSLGMLNAFDITEDVILGLHGDGKLYVRCSDVHNNINPTSYIVNFCINEGPDTTPVNFDSQTGVLAIPKNGATLPYGTNSTPFKIFINEPAECKYDGKPSTSYDLMNNTLECSTSPTPELLGRWGCETPLDNDLSLNPGENKIYIKCKDKPWETNESKRNTNVDDYLYKLFVTEDKLEIGSIYITVGGSRFDLTNNYTKVTGGVNQFSIDLTAQTSGGNENGKAECSYKFEQSPILYTGDRFFETNANTHKQKGLNLLNGNYNISIKCNDDFDNDGISNVAETSGTFNLNVDMSPPLIVRTYRDGNSLKLKTDESAKCAYSNQPNYCQSGSVSNGTSMTSGFSTDHSTSWNPGQIYYIKCKDIYDRESQLCARIIIPGVNVE